MKYTPKMFLADTVQRANNRVRLAAKVEEFYNRCHDIEGKFCPSTGPGGITVKPDVGIVGKASSGTISKPPSPQPPLKLPNVKGAKTWPETSGRPVTTVAKVRFGSVSVDGIKAKAVYEVETKSGNKIRLYDQSGKAEPYKNALLQNHARMNEMYPLKPPRNLVILPLNSKAIGPHTVAHVRSGLPFTFVNSKYLGFNVKNSTNFYMPSSQTGDTKDMDYLLTHEYGHHYDLTKNVEHGTFRATYKPNALMKNHNFYNNLSRYGKVHEVEAYAEAFAEWHHSQGKTQNPAAIALARSEGWYGSSSSKAVKLSLDPVTLALTTEEFPNDTQSDIDATLPKTDLPGISVMDNFEKDPTITGNYTLVPPTKEEIAQADALMNAVLDELNLTPSDTNQSFGLSSSTP